MTTNREQMDKTTRQMLVTEGVYDLYKDQLEEAKRMLNILHAEEQ